MKNILLINPFSATISGVNRATIEPPLGLAYIASLLESRGHRCQIIDALILRLPPEKIHRRISINPELIGISANIVTYPAALKTAEALAIHYKNIPIILGGPHPSALPEQVLQHPYVDAVVIGEAEMTMAEIVQRLEQKEYPFEQIDGVVYKKGNTTVFNKPRALIPDLDTLPFPAYHLLPNLRLYKSRARKSPVGQLFTSRGCCYQCTFCNKDIFMDKVRLRSAKNIIQEIDWLVSKYGIRQLDILDDNFNFNLIHSKEILDLIITRGYDLAINIQNGMRVDNVNLDLLDKMKLAGVFKIGFGIETVDPQIQRNIKKVQDLDKIITVTKAAQTRDIAVYANFILGLPGDTVETMQKSIDFAIALSPDIANFMIALPLPGTELYRQVKESGRLLVPVEDGVEQGFYGHTVFFEMGASSAKEILACYRRAYRRFYFRLSWLFCALRNIRSVGEVLWFKDAVFDLTKSVLFNRE